MGEIEKPEQQNPPGAWALPAAGWVLVLAGIAGFFLPIVPGSALLVAGACLLSRRYHWARRAAERYRTRFPILNRILPAEQAGDAPAPLVSILPSKNRLVLIFDTDPDDLARCAWPFEVRGIEVHKCTTIEAAMRCIEREEFDLALIDQVSSAFEGRRVITHLVRYNWPIPFILLGNERDARCLRQALDLGVVGYLEKPVSSELLNVVVQQFLENSLRRSASLDNTFHELTSRRAG